MPRTGFLFPHPIQAFPLERQKNSAEVLRLFRFLWSNDGNGFFEISPAALQLRVKEVELCCRLIALKIHNETDVNQSDFEWTMPSRTGVNLRPNRFRIFLCAALINAYVSWGSRSLGGGFASSPEDSRRPPDS